jgi:hypothetical protein
MTPRGAQAQRTGLAWQRTALAAGACTLLLLHSASLRDWGATTVPAVVAGCTAVVLAVVGKARERQLRRPGPPFSFSASRIAHPCRANPGSGWVSPRRPYRSGITRPEIHAQRM